MPPEINDERALPVILEDLLQSGFSYHTIQYVLKPGPETRQNVERRDTLWNLPVAYRPIMDSERHDISGWLKELQDQNIPAHEEPRGWEYLWDRRYDIPTQDPLKDRGDFWDSLQLLLHYLSEGKPWIAACARVTQARARGKERTEFYKEKDKMESENARLNEIDNEGQPYFTRPGSVKLATKENKWQAASLRFI
jgi:hypothetical protein